LPEKNTAENGSIPPILPRDALEMTRLLDLEPKGVSGIRITPLGGLKAVGGPNAWLIESPAEGQLLIDCGQQVSEKEGPLPDTFFPDFSRINPKQLRGVVISHGHYDHVAALPKLLSEVFAPQRIPLEIWGSAETLLIAKRIFNNSEIDNWEELVALHKLLAKQEISEFKISTFPLHHSIPGALGILVSVDGKNICYPGDFKYLRSEWSELQATSERFQEIALAGIDTLILDATNVRMGGFTTSTSGVMDEFANIFQNPEYQDKRIIVSTFASDVDILAEIAFLAQEIGERNVRPDGRSMRFYFDTFDIAKKDIASNSPFLLCVTGCQAETDASLTRLSRDEHFDLKLRSDDIVIISANAIPSNQQKIKAMIKRLRKRVYKVITPQEQNIHVSGHGSRKDLLKAAADFMPRTIIPCHAHQALRKQLRELINKDPKLSKTTKAIALDEGDSYEL